MPCLPSMDRRTALTRLAALTIASTAPAAFAQSFPDRPVSIVVPFSPGGSIDTIARVLAQYLNEQTGKTFIVDNKVGASGNIGAQYVARSKPDGHTLLFTSLTTASISDAMYVNGIGYDLGKDVVPLALVCELPVVLIASLKSGIKNWRDLLAVAKIRQDGLVFGSSGVGSIEHLTMELFTRAASIERALHVPYKGGADALRDLMGDQIDLIFATGGAMFTAMEAGSISGIAVASANRAPIVPDLPTLQENGLADFDSSVIYGFLTPPGIPEDVARYLNTHLQTVLKHPQVIRGLGEQSAEVNFVGVDGARATLQEQMRKWGGLVRELGIRAD